MHRHQIFIDKVGSKKNRQEVISRLFSVVFIRNTEKITNNNWINNVLVTSENVEFVWLKKILFVRLPSFLVL